MGGAGTECTKAAPCGTLDDGVRTGKSIVKMATGIVADGKTTMIDGKTVTIVADPGAKLGRTGPGVILSVQNDGADVRIYDLEITGSIGPTNPAISVPSGGAPRLTLTRVIVDINRGVGISAAAGVVTISRSTVSGNGGLGISASGGTLTVSRSNVDANTGGGISISDAQFGITNSFITRNGSGTTILGGVRIDGITVAGTHVLDFNTISANLGPATINTGVACGTVLVPLTFSSNIIYANIVSGGGVQVGGSPNCVTTYSDVGPDAQAGAGNINMDPMFVSPPQSNFHLMSASPAKDVADPAATLAADFDGDVRPQGTRRDMGADEINQ